jgi:hypothetical protein
MTDEPNITPAPKGTFTVTAGQPHYGFIYGTPGEHNGPSTQGSDNVLRLSGTTIKAPTVLCPKHGETDKYLSITHDNWETRKHYCTLCWEETLIASGCGPLELVK